MDLKDFLNSEGRVSSTKTTEKYILKNLPEDYIKIKSHSEKINLVDVKFSEEIYYYLNGLDFPVVCKNCKINKPRFLGLLNGYLGYCSSKCSNGDTRVKKLKEKSYLDRYGVKNPSQSDEVIGKIQETFDLKYGGNPFSVFQDRIKKTNINKYGTSHPLSRESNLRDKMSKDLVLSFLKKYEGFEIIDYEEIKGGTCKVKCKVCLNEFTISKWNLHQRIKNSKIENPCTICNPIGSSNETGIETFIKKILDKNRIPYQEKNRSILEGKEIDFYLPDHKIGIEVNGLFWHSEKFKGENYHLDKTKFASDRGIYLIHIFEDEIENNPILVESRIKAIVGIYDNKFFARKCKVKEISNKDSGNFLKENHMQGNAGARINLGLFLDDDLISVMTFGNLRVSLGSKSKENHWELIRFANKKGNIVIGGASKLLSYFRKKNHPEKIISYCDRRWSKGDFYEKIGFLRFGETVPNYWYIKNGKREGRFKYRKNKLVEEGYSRDKTESQIMEERGFLKIYDCGSFKFIIDSIS